ncbi:MAG: TIR domain-containing protein [Blastocatellia bacterium]|nr:TIR domain-containing protein [Blastocatellia bacterium]
MSYLFFLSYAREDNNSEGLVRKFYEDLSKDIAGKIAASPNDVGFFDGAEIEHGAIWDQKLASALQQSSVFIAIYSPYYFQKKFCGKEWAVFKSRVDAYAKSRPQGAEFPGLMFPVLWQKEDYVKSIIPAVIGNIQYKFDGYGKAYAEQGLRVMMRNRKFRQQYDDFIPVLADKIIEASRLHNAPALPNLPPLDQVAEAFPAPASTLARGAAAQAAPPQIAGANPRYVKFIFLAGRRQELRPFRASLDPYGERGGEWRPWLPDPKDEVDLLVQDVIQRERLIMDGEIPLDNELEERLDDAENSDKIVVIVVDLWTLQLANYRKLMHEVVDPKQLVNCVIVVPWNPQDPEAINQRQTLEDLLQSTFVKRTANDSPDLLTQIDSATKLRDRLAAMLQVTRSKIIKRAEVLRKATGAEAIALSNIEGPGGN